MVKRSKSERSNNIMPEVIFPGPDGRLEGRYHPHYAFYNMGFTVLRFNFRGVGRSQGEYDQGVGELSDAASALDYLQAMNPNAKHCWVAGFSFGAWIGMQLLMRRPEISGFISAAPPANLVGKLHEQKGITITHEVIEGSGHFFENDHMDTMIGSVDTYVRRRLTENTR